MKSLGKINGLLALLFCVWSVWFVQDANAIDEGNLRLFAYGLRVVYSEANETYTFYFKSTSAHKSGELVFYYDKDEDDNQNELTSIVGRYTFQPKDLGQNDEGEYYFSLDKKDIPGAALNQRAYLNMTWAIKLKGEMIIGRNPEATTALNYSLNQDWSYNRGSYQGTSNKLSNNEGALQAQVKEPRRLMEDHKFRCPQGIAIDNNPHSPYFGRVYVANAPTGKNLGADEISSNPYTQGIVVYEPNPTTGTYIKIAEVAIENSFFHPAEVALEHQRYFLHRIAVNPVDGNVYFCSSGSNYQSAIYQLTPTKDGLDWNGKINVTEQLITSTGFADHPLHPINSFAFGPGGELYVMSAARSGTKVNDSESLPRGNGKIYKLTKSDENSDYYDRYEQYYTPSTEPQEKNGTEGEPFNIDPWIHADNSMVVNARGGFWVTQKRDNVDKYAFLAHIHPLTGYQSDSTYATSLEPFFQFVMSAVDEETFSGNHLSPYSTTKQLLDPHTPGGSLNSDYTSPCGQVAIYEKNGLSSTEAFLAVGFKGRVCVFKLIYREKGTWYGFNYDWMFEIPIGDKNSTIDGLAFDYAGNLFIASESRHKLYVYSLPNYQPMILSNDPAMQPLAFEKEHGGRLTEFTSAIAPPTKAWNNLNRGEPLDDNSVAVPAKFEYTVDAAIVYDQNYNDGNFDKQWSNDQNWNIQRIPGKEDIPVIIRSDAVIDEAQAVGGVILENGSTIDIATNGGLTIGKGGVTGAAEDGSSIVVHNNSSRYGDGQGAGYLRIDPKVAAEDIPKVHVTFTTAAQPGNNTGNEHRLWQYIGAPGAGTKVTLTRHTWIYRHDEKDGWQKESSTFDMQPFAGYAITQEYTPTYDWVSTPINQSHEVVLQKTGSGDNIFANSYLAPINVAAFNKDDFEGEVDKTFYIFNTGSWTEWNDAATGGGDGALDDKQSSGQYTAIPVLSAGDVNPNEDPTLIAPMQGVYVIAKEDGAKIKLNYEKHVWNTTSPGNNAMRMPDRAAESDDLLRRIRIQAYGENSGSDRIYILQDTRCTAGYDNGYDGKNMPAAGQVNIYTNEPCGRMEISASNTIDSMYIGFCAGADTIYTLRFSSLIGDSLYIKDLVTDSVIALTEDGRYRFSAPAKSDTNMRFQVLLHPYTGDDSGSSGTTTSVEDIPSTRLWLSGNTICIATGHANNTAALYNMSGQELISVRFSDHVEIPTTGLGTGVYVIRVNDERYKLVNQ